MAFARSRVKKPPVHWQELMIGKVCLFLRKHWWDTEEVLMAEEFFEASQTWLKMRTMSSDGYLSFATMQPEEFFAFLGIDPGEPRVKSQIRSTWLILFPEYRLSRLRGIWLRMSHSTSREMFFARLNADMLKGAKNPYECHLIAAIDPKILFAEIMGDANP